MINLEQHKIFLQDQGIYVLPYEIVQLYLEQLQSKFLDELQVTLNTLDESLTEISDDFDKLTDLLDLNDSDKL
jgi:hypothetical protein